MMYSPRRPASLMRFLNVLPALFFNIGAVTADVDPGYNVAAASQAMTNLASHSWEWGTAAVALLEYQNSALSVFGANPFPGGKIPSADPGIPALAYAKRFIQTNGQTLVPNSAIGDPASLGVPCILLGQSNSVYIGAADRQADYLLNKAPRYGNGAIAHQPDPALWADFVAMAPPFLAYQAVAKNNVSLMAETVRQCGLYRDVLKTGQSLIWRHIIGPQYQDTGHWSTGNGWAAYGMVRVLYTLQKWSGSSSMTSQAGQLKTWIKEILDGAMSVGTESGLLRNYLDDNSWFGEISGTSLLTAVAYRMAVNDPAMFPQRYITWADSNRATLSRLEGANGIFSPAVNPLNWGDRNKDTSGSPEGQAFTVYLFTAYRDCVQAGICKASVPSGCGTSRQSCDANGCAGKFQGSTPYAVCTGGSLKGCTCTATPTTCGNPQSCTLNGCAGACNGSGKAYCTNNFVGCQCSANC